MPGEITPSAASAPFDAICKSDSSGDYWSARDLQPLLGYSVWRDFANAVERAKVTCQNSGHPVASNFADARKIGTAGPSGVDYRLSRYAAYLVAMNGDPRKPEVAAAQTYFAVKTREAEVTVPAQRELSRRDLARMVIEAEDRADAEAVRADSAEQHAAELEPAAHSWNTLAEATGDFMVGDAAKILSRDPNITIGQNRLFTLMRELGWIYRGGDSRWRTKQAAVEARRLCEIPKTHFDRGTGEIVVDPPQIRVTVKGIAYLHRHLGGVRPPAIPADQLTITGGAS